MNSLTIAHTTIHQDEHGRYSLNDLYKAAGGENRHRPSHWLKLQRTKLLVEELQSVAGIPATGTGERSRNSGFAPIEVIQGGDAQLQGTYVAKDLVYDYAMWISPAFQIKVTRAYDALMRGDLNACGSKRVQFERWWFKRYPNDSAIRTMAYQGEPYWFIALSVRRATGTVGRRVAAMIECGLIEAQRLRSARIGMQTWWAFRRKHFNQLALF